MEAKVTVETNRARLEGEGEGEGKGANVGFSEEIQDRGSADGLLEIGAGQRVQNAMTGNRV